MSFYCSLDSLVVYATMYILPAHPRNHPNFKPNWDKPHVFWWFRDLWRYADGPKNKYRSFECHLMMGSNISPVPSPPRASQASLKKCRFCCLRWLKRSNSKRVCDYSNWPSVSIMATDLHFKYSERRRQYFPKQRHIMSSWYSKILKAIENSVRVNMNEQTTF